VSVHSTTETNECSDDNCDERNTDHVEIQRRRAERYMKGLLFGFLPKHTLKEYAEEDGTDHSQSSRSHHEDPSLQRFSERGAEDYSATIKQDRSAVVHSVLAQEAWDNLERSTSTMNVE
jgi:hypothetical protein